MSEPLIEVFPVIDIDDGRTTAQSNSTGTNTPQVVEPPPPRDGVGVDGEDV